MVTGAADEAGRRAYHSTRRQEQAAQTRALVVAAASSLFAERGWVATGMRDVAKAAGVAVETVYANFRSKRELLTAIDVAPRLLDSIYARLIPAHQDRDARLAQDLTRIGEVARSRSTR